MNGIDPLFDFMASLRNSIRTLDFRCVVDHKKGALPSPRAILRGEPPQAQIYFPWIQNMTSPAVSIWPMESTEVLFMPIKARG